MERRGVKSLKLVGEQNKDKNLSDFVREKTLKQLTSTLVDCRNNYKHKHTASVESKINADDILLPELERLNTHAQSNLETLKEISDHVDISPINIEMLFNEELREILDKYNVTFYNFATSDSTLLIEHVACFKEWLHQVNAHIKSNLLDTFKALTPLVEQLISSTENKRKQLNKLTLASEKGIATTIEEYDKILKTLYKAKGLYSLPAVFKRHTEELYQRINDYWTYFNNVLLAATAENFNCEQHDFSADFDRLIKQYKEFFLSKEANSNLPSDFSSYIRYLNAQHNEYELNMTKGKDIFQLLPALFSSPQQLNDNLNKLIENKPELVGEEGQAFFFKVLLFLVLKSIRVSTKLKEHLNLLKTLASNVAITGKEAKELKQILATIPKSLQEINDVLHIVSSEEFPGGDDISLYLIRSYSASAKAHLGGLPSSKSGRARVSRLRSNSMPIHLDNKSLNDHSLPQVRAASPMFSTKSLAQGKTSAQLPQCVIPGLDDNASKRSLDVTLSKAACETLGYLVCYKTDFNEDKQEKIQCFLALILKILSLKYKKSQVDFIEASAEKYLLRIIENIKGSFQNKTSNLQRPLDFNQTYHFIGHNFTLVPLTPLQGACIT